MRARQRRESGVALVGAGIWFLALAAMVAIAVEIARLTDTATEVQTAADSAALAGALALSQGHPELAVARGQAAAGNNQADGRAVASAGVQIDVGHYSTDPSADPHFTTPCTGGANCNAVKATVTVDNVQYIFASIFGGSSTSVQKTAVSGAQCQGSANDTLPLAVCKQALNYVGQDDLCVNGTLHASFTMQSTSNVCWSSLAAGTGNNVIQSLFPKECGGTASSASRYVTLQENIRLLGTGGGVAGQTWNQLQCCIACQSNHRFTVPVIDCPELATGGNPCTSGGKPVVAFATIDLTLVSDGSASQNNCGAGQNFPPGGCSARVDNGPPQRMEGSQVCDPGNPGTPGGAQCTNFGNTVAPVMGQLP